jgi:hypothetical protein
LAGDDIRLVVTAKQGVGAYSNLLAAAFKFRPVTAVVLWLSTVASQGQYSTLLYIGVGLHTLNAFIFYRLLRHVFLVSALCSVCLTVIASFNRFTAYLMTPELALMEGAAITCYLLFLWALLRLTESSKTTWAVLVALSFFIILHIHERYMVLAGACLIVSALIYKNNRLASFITCLGPVAALATNFIAKKLVIHVPILVGTTSQAIEFNPKAILGFILDGLANMWGINQGPSYLSVLDYNQAPGWFKLLSITIATLSFLLVASTAFYATRSLKSARSMSNCSWMLIPLSCLVLLLILSASITFRQEYRWLHPAYLTFLLLLGLGVRIWSEGAKRPFANICLACLFILVTCSEVTIRRFSDNYYSRLAYHVANNLYVVIKQSPEINSRKVIIIGGDQVPYPNYIFMGDMFSDLYRLPHLVFSTATSAKNGEMVEAPAILYSQADQKFTLIPSLGGRDPGR